MSVRHMALCLEQTLGHRTHGLNLQRALCEGDAADVFEVQAPAANRLRVPWAVRGSLQARSRMRATGREYAVSLFHTQSVSLFARSAAGGGEYVVSVDATPKQFDAVGNWYGHSAGWSVAERWKQERYRRVFRGAAGLVAWSEWAAGSLASDYGVGRERVLVAHPGAGPEFFAIERGARHARPVILFVGGDFERKGGPLLVEAWRLLAGRADLVLVTEANVAPEPGLRVERGVRPGPRLQALYASADIFCLPTLGDCTPVVIGEAMAAGLPVVTTDIASNRETVRDGETGLLTPPGDGMALGAALGRLVTGAGEREAMGRAAREHAREYMDAQANARRVLDYMRKVAS